MTKARPLTRDSFSTFYPVQTRWADNDIYGHVNNVTYYAYFDSVINRYLIEKAALDIHQGEVIGFIVQSQCHFYAPIAFPDELTAGLKVTRIGNSSVTYQVGLFKQGDNRTCAVGEMTHVFVDRQNNQPVDIENPLLSALQAVLSE